MRANDEHEEETVEVIRPDRSTIVFARRLDLEVIGRPGADVVLFRRRRASGRSDDVLRCMEFLEVCHANVAKTRAELFAELVGQAIKGKLPLEVVLVAQGAIETFILDLMAALCVCDKSPPVPDQDHTTILNLNTVLIIVAGVAGILIIVMAPGAGAAAVAAAVEAGATPAAAAAAGLKVQLAMSVIGSVLSAGSSILDEILDRMLHDPPDPDFAGVPTIKEFELPDVDLSALSEAVAVSLRQLVGRWGESIAAGQAVIAAFEKFQGAVLANDTEAQARQLAAAADFAEILADSLERQVAPRTALVAALRSAGFGTVITPAHALDAAVKVVPSGPPDAFRQVAEHYRVADVDALWLRAFSNPMAAVGVFPESLNPPALAAAEIKAAESLRTSAAKWRA